MESSFNRIKNKRYKARSKEILLIMIFCIGLFSMNFVSSAPWNVTLNDGLVGYWGFGSSDTILKESVFGVNNGTNGAGYTSDGKNGGSVNFTKLNTTSYVTIDNEANFDLLFSGSVPFTYHSWAYPTDTGVLISKGFDPAVFAIGNMDYGVTNGVLVFWKTRLHNDKYAKTADGVLPLNQWSSVVVRYYGSSVVNVSEVSVSVNGVNKTLTLSGTANETLANDNPVLFGHGFLNTIERVWKGKIDEVALWNRTLTDNEILELNTSMFYEVSFPTSLQTTLVSPANLSLITYNNVSFNASYSFTGLNITNATYYIWNSTNQIFNKTTVTVSSALNTSSLNIGGFTVGTYKWNVFACGKNTTSTICSWGSSGNYTIDFAGSVLNEFYNTETTETSSEYFTANFSLFSGSNVISVRLIYNGTSYAVSDITNYGNIIELKRTIDIPLLASPTNQTKQFLWSFVFSNGGLINYNTSLRSQNVFPINIFYCNSTYRTVTLNFTTYNELNPNPIINSTFHTAWNFWTGSGTTKKTYSFEDTSLGNSSFKFCIDPNWTTLKTDLSAEITSTGFLPRTYYLTNASINNVTQEVPLRLINESSGVKFFHTIRDSVTRVEDATVIINKYDVGLASWVVVGIRKSDSDGKFIEYLELDKDYSYTISKNGVLLAIVNKTSICEASPCSLDLEISSSSVNLWSGYYDSFAENVVYNLSYNKDSKIVTFNFVDTSGLANYFRLQVDLDRANQSGVNVCNSTLYATLGTLTCNLTGYAGSFTASTYISRSPEKPIAFIKELISFFATELGKDSGLFFALMLVVIVGLIGAWNPAVGVLFAGLAFIFAGIMGFIMISMTGITLVAILIIILIVKMGRNQV